MYKEIHGVYNGGMTKILSLDDTTLFIGPPHPESITSVYRLDKSSGICPPILKDALNGIDATAEGISIDNAIYFVSKFDWKLDGKDVVYTIELSLCSNF